MGDPPDAEERLDKIAAGMIPLMRRAEAVEAGHAVLYLASGDAGYVSSDLVIDGGWTTV